MKTLERRQWGRVGVFIVNCEHVSHFFIVFDFEQANFCYVHNEKKNTFEEKIGYIMRHVLVFSV